MNNPTLWADLTQDERLATRNAMLTHGGDFVRAMARAISFSDPANEQRLTLAFPELAERYGPGSGPYEACRTGSVNLGGPTSALAQKLPHLVHLWQVRAGSALPADAMLINRHIRELQTVLNSPGPAVLSK